LKPSKADEEERERETEAINKEGTRLT